MKKKYKFGLRKKLVVFISVLSIITYSTSAFFIYFLYNQVKDYLPFGEEIFTIMTLSLGIFWSGFLGYLAAGFIIKPLQILEEGVHRAANGEIDQDVEVVKSDDEIRSLGLAFNDMLASLRKMVENIEGNFVSTNNCVDKITKTSETAATHAESFSKTIEDIAKGAERSASAISSTVESIDTVTEISKKVLNHATESQQISSDMVVSLDSSKKVILSLVDGIEKLAKDNQESLVSVQRLEKNAKEVEHIISLVGDIAGQTNLLALNASIEAARAGEQGKGFAVVAEEVRKLADQSAKAVQGISDLVENMQAEVKNVVEQIHEQVTSANKGAEKGSETNVAIEKMTASVLKMEQAVKQIADLAEKQMKCIQVTSAESQEVAAIAEQTSAGSQEVAASIQEQTAMIDDVVSIATELSKQAESLNQTIRQFKVGGR